MVAWRGVAWRESSVFMYRWKLDIVDIKCKWPFKAEQCKNDEKNKEQKKNSNKDTHARTHKY